MSGIEVAGIVLGAFPILLNALDYYREGCEPLRDFWTFDRTFNNFIDDVRHERMLYEGTLEQLLRPLSADEDELKMLLRLPEKWKDDTLKEGIAKRLGSEHDRFLRQIKRMDEIMSSLRKFLKTEDTSWITQDWALGLQKLRFSFSQGKHTKIVKLHKLNKQLKDIVGCTQAPIGDNSTAALQHPPKAFEKFRQRALAVHNALRTRWRCQCDDATTHRASLLVQHNPGDDEPLNIRFELPTPNNVGKHCHVVKMTEPHHKSTSAITQKSIMTLTHDDLIELQDTFNAKAQTSPSQQSRFSMSKWLGKSKSNQLPINLPTEPSSASLGSIKSSTRGNASSGPSYAIPTQRPDSTSVSHAQTESENIVIDDLCSKLAHPPGPDRCLGYVVDDHSRKFLVVREVQSPIHQDLPLSSVAAALRSAHCGRTEFERRDRFQAILGIATSLLQVQVSPWLLPVWTSEDFFLAEDAANCRILSDHLFVTQHYASQAAPMSPGTGNPSDSLPLTEDETRDALTRLGILMLELIFGHEISQCMFYKNFLGPNHQPNDHTDICAALKWSQKVARESGPEIEGAVKCCLIGNFGPPRPNLLDREFRKSFYSSVVKPIEEYCTSTWKGTARIT